MTNNTDLSACVPSGGKLVTDIEISESPVYTTLVYTYLLTLGEYNLNNFGGTRYPEFVWILFLAATFGL